MFLFYWPRAAELRTCRDATVSSSDAEPAAVLSMGWPLTTALLFESRRQLTAGLACDPGRIPEMLQA
jgi:hypothetical protein